FLILIATLLIQVCVYANDSVEVAYSTRDSAAVVNQLVSSMADQLTQNKNFGDIQASAIAITSFVCLEDFKATSRLSNILSENFIHEMQIRGYKVIDFKTMSNIKIDSQGDFLFSRDILTLQTSLNVNYALTGTYTEYDSGLVINARIIDLQTHIILSTAQILIPKRVVNRISSAGNKIVDFMPNKISLSK
ncbi:MAG: FlgO family outer membrane protein, partial [Sulfurimonas sp.]|nr:FlgO family outer membrane protein [Sulfurimonas sp.]